jgi:ribose-phosphate pyrophosphokinase
MADKMGANSVVTILKRRVAANVIDAMQIVGEVEGLICVIVDDIIDTAGTFSILESCDIQSNTLLIVGVVL